MVEAPADKENIRTDFRAQVRRCWAWSGAKRAWVSPEFTAQGAGACRGSAGLGAGL